MTQDALARADEGGYHLKVRGEVDLATAPDLQKQAIGVLADPTVSTLTLDLSDVTFIDSTGIGTLVQLRLTAEARDKKLVLARPSDRVQRVLAITALAGTFSIDDTSSAPEAPLV